MWQCVDGRKTTDVMEELPATIFQVCDVQKECPQDNVSNFLQTDTAAYPRRLDYPPATNVFTCYQTLWKVMVVILFQILCQMDWKKWMH
jgi:hypothetical protein